MDKTILAALLVSLGVSGAVVGISHATRDESQAVTVVDGGQPTAPAAEPPADEVVLVTRPSTPLATDTEAHEALVARVHALETEVQQLRERVGALNKEVLGPDLTAMPVDQLRRRAFAFYRGRNYEDALKYFLEVRARGTVTDTDELNHLLRSIAGSYFQTGNLDKADETYLEIEKMHGEGTAGALAARYQRAHILGARKDYAAARAMMLEVHRAPNTSEFWRMYSRANAAQFAINAGDKEIARAELEEYKAELEGNTTTTGTRVRGYVESLLNSLKDE